MVWHKSNSKWEARIYEGGKQKFLGYYLSEDAAARAYDAYAGAWVPRVCGAVARGAGRVAGTRDEASERGVEPACAG